MSGLAQCETLELAHAGMHDVNVLHAMQSSPSHVPKLLAMKASANLIVTKLALANLLTLIYNDTIFA